MTEQDALEFIHTIPRMGKKPGLRRISMLLERMGNPQHRLKFVHVAGTNGKGSTCVMLSRILWEAGYRTGLCISPFVLDFRERIQVDNKMISPQALADCTAAVKVHWEALNAIGEPPAEFEVVVAVALEYFARCACDLVVLEVGMGGRTDATNVIPTPLCAVITSIGIDHTRFLGDTLEQIAGEKCGIIKAGGRTVTYPCQEPEALAVIMEVCARQENPLFSANTGGVTLLEQDIAGSRFRYEEREYTVPLGGMHQVYNALTVLETVKVLRLTGLAVLQEAVERGMAETRFPSRLEVLCRRPLVLLDGAHNRSGMEALARSLDLLEGRRIHAVLGMVDDKDADGALAVLLPRLHSLVVTAPDIYRALPAGVLAEKARPLCAKVEAVENPREAARMLLERCRNGDVALICGSLYLTSLLRPVALELSKMI